MSDHEFSFLQRLVLHRSISTQQSRPQNTEWGKPGTRSLYTSCAAWMLRSFEAFPVLSPPSQMCVWEGTHPLQNTLWECSFWLWATDEQVWIKLAWKPEMWSIYHRFVWAGMSSNVLQNSLSKNKTAVTLFNFYLNKYWIYTTGIYLCHIC